MGGFETRGGRQARDWENQCYGLSIYFYTIACSLLQGTFRAGRYNIRTLDEVLLRKWEISQSRLIYLHLITCINRSGRVLSGARLYWVPYHRPMDNLALDQRLSYHWHLLGVKLEREKPNYTVLYLVEDFCLGWDKKSNIMASSLYSTQHHVTNKKTTPQRISKVHCCCLSTWSWSCPTIKHQPGEMGISSRYINVGVIFL